METGSEGMAGGAEGGATPPMPMAEESNEEKSVTIPAAQLPKGVEAKEGTELTFCLHGPPDEQGNVTGYFKGGNEESGEAGSSWEDDFRKSMSPRAEGPGSETGAA